jgi:hypothetical protein
VPDPTNATPNHRRVTWNCVLGTEHERRREGSRPVWFVIAAVALWATSPDWECARSSFRGRAGSSTGVSPRERALASVAWPIVATRRVGQG